MFDNVASVEREDPFVLAAALADLGLEQISALPMNQAEAVVVATQRIVNAVTARQSAALDTHAARAEERSQRRRQRGPRRRSQAPARQPGLDSAAALALLRVAPRTMSARLSDARRLVNALPATFDLQWSGDLEPYRSAAVVRESALSLEHLEEFEARLHRRDVADVPCSRLRTMARRAAAETDLAVRDAARKAADQRSIRVSPGEVTGMSTWTISLPVATSTRLWSAVDGLANEYLRAAPGLKADHARVDALVDLATANAEIRTTIELVAPIGSGPASRTDLGPLDLRDEPLHDLPEAFGGPQRLDASGDHVADGGGGRAGGRGRGGGGGGGRAGGRGRGGGRGGRQDDASDDRRADCGSEALWSAVRESTGALMNSGDEVWFVNGLTEVPTLGSLLPATVVDLLGPRCHPPGGVVRPGHRCHPGTGPDGLPALRRSRSTGPVQGRHLPVPRVCPACEANSARPRHSRPGGADRGRQPHVSCTSHHRFKHHGGWRVELTPGASAPGRRPTAGPTPPGRSTATDAAWPDGPLPGIRAKATPRHTLGRVMHSLGPDWMDPQWLLERFGGQFFWVSAAIVFIECGLLFPILPGDSLLFAVGLFIAEGSIDINIVAACLILTAAAFLGNVTGYEIGRAIGAPSTSGRAGSSRRSTSTTPTRSSRSTAPRHSSSVASCPSCAPSSRSSPA